jgi:hypothetical protein
MTSKTELLAAGAANVSVGISINASIEKTWSGLVNHIGQWWRNDFLVCEGTLGMALEPRIGGLL